MASKPTPEFRAEAVRVTLTSARAIRMLAIMPGRRRDGGSRATWCRFPFDLRLPVLARGYPGPTLEGARKRTLI